MQLLKALIEDLSIAIDDVFGVAATEAGNRQKEASTEDLIMHRHQKRDAPLLLSLSLCHSTSHSITLCYVPLESITTVCEGQGMLGVQVFHGQDMLGVKVCLRSRAVKGQGMLGAKVCHGQYVMLRVKVCLRSRSCWGQGLFGVKVCQGQGMFVVNVCQGQGMFEVKVCLGSRYVSGQGVVWGQGLSEVKVCLGSRSAWG